MSKAVAARVYAPHFFLDISWYSIIIVFNTIIGYIHTCHCGLRLESINPDCMFFLLHWPLAISNQSIGVSLPISCSEWEIMVGAVATPCSKDVRAIFTFHCRMASQLPELQPFASIRWKSRLLHCEGVTQSSGHRLFKQGHGETAQLHVEGGPGIERLRQAVQQPQRVRRGPSGDRVSKMHPT